MKKDRIHIYEMESYKHASEEQRNSMRICKIRYFDLEGLPSKEVKEILEAFIWERGKTLALSSLATELTTYNNIRKFLIEKNITVLQNAYSRKDGQNFKGVDVRKGIGLVQHEIPGCLRYNSQRNTSIGKKTASDSKIC